jgi:hypothetical protein
MAQRKGKSLSANSWCPKMVTAVRSTSRNPNGATWSRGSGRKIQDAIGEKQTCLGQVGPEA